MFFKKKTEIDFYDYLFMYQSKGINILEDNNFIINDPLYEDYLKIRSDKLNPIQNQICQIMYDRQNKLLENNHEFQITHIQSANINIDFNKELIREFENSIQVVFKISKMSTPEQTQDIDNSILLMDTIRVLTSWSVIPGQIDYTTITRVNNIFRNMIIPIDIQLSYDFKQLGKSRTYDQMGTSNFYLVVKRNLIPEEQQTVQGVE